ncbi:unnamed protein product, partial [Ascophyllum nodosum]
VFSSNEDLEEIDTQMLPLLAADFYLGSLVTKLPFTRPETRLGMLKRAEALLFKYLDTCERLDLFEEADLAAWQSMLKDGERSSAGAVRMAVPREQKVQRFRPVVRQQRIRQKMDEIERELDDANAADGRDHSGREGRMRERSMLLLASLAADAMDELSGVSMEMEMLEHRLKAVQHTQGTDTGREQNQQGREERGEHGGAGSRNAGLEVTHISRVGGSLNIRKEGIRAGVFKPTVAPPTMTVEEFGEIELERARQRQARHFPAILQSTLFYTDDHTVLRRYDQLEMDGDEDEQELVEASVYRDREWDDWKDNHPRGAGNKSNKII